MFRNGISKETRSYVTGNMDDGINLSSSDYATTSKRKKNRRDMFISQMKKYCLSLKVKDDELFSNRSKNPGIVLKPLNDTINHVVDILCLQQLEYDLSRSFIMKWNELIFLMITIVINWML